MLSFLDNIKLHLHSLMSVYLGYFQPLSKDMPVSPHYGVAYLAHTASSHLKCMLGCWRTNKRIQGGRMRWRQSDQWPAQSCVWQMGNQTGRACVVNMCSLSSAGWIWWRFPQVSLLPLPQWQSNGRERMWKQSVIEDSMWCLDCAQTVVSELLPARISD